MDDGLPEELCQLRATVRRLAREKVAPRASAVDAAGGYPEDVFECFRAVGLLALSIPTAYGGSGAGVLGLTAAVEEVAKASDVAALMLVLTGCGPQAHAFRRGSRAARCREAPERRWEVSSARAEGPKLSQPHAMI